MLKKEKKTKIKIQKLKLKFNFLTRIRLVFAMMWKVIHRKRLLIAKQLAVLVAGISSISWIQMYPCLLMLSQVKNQSRLSSWDWLNFCFTSLQRNVSAVLLAPTFFCLPERMEQKSKWQ